MKCEIWKAVPGFVGYYEVSTWGRVRSVDRIIKCKGKQKTRRWQGRLLKPYLAEGEYSRYFLVYLSKHSKVRGYFIHNLVLAVFVGPCPQGMECRHLDGDSLNNNLTNLRYGTPRENAKDRARHGTQTRGETHAVSKLTEKQAIQVKRLFKSGKYTLAQIGAMFDISYSQVSLIGRGLSWKHLP